MKQTLVVAFDDLDWAEKQERVPADETVIIGLRGRWRELDLTREHLVELERFLQRFMEAGTEPVLPPKPPSRPRKKGSGPQTPTGKAREYGRNMRAWADERGRTDEYRTKGGHFYPKQQLVRDYTAYLAEQSSPYQLVAREPEGYDHSG